MNPKAVIFDMDGVLVDTMPFHYRAWQKTFKEFGVRVSKKEIYLREGEKWDKTFTEILKRNGRKIDAKVKKAVFKHREKVFGKLLKIKLFSGAEAILEKLAKENIKLGLATGTPRRELRRILPKKLYKLFSAIVPSDEVKRGKPHPEPYLKALKKLKVKASEAVVIENAPNGIKSAKRAGIRCIAIETSLPKPYLKEADLILDSIKEIQPTRLSELFEENLVG